MPKQRILLELRVDDKGVMTLEATGDRVSGIPLGEPKLLTHVDVHGEKGDIFTSRVDYIASDAPELANAYSPGRTKRNNEDAPFTIEQIGNDTHYRQTVQYFKLDKKSIELARSRIF